MKDVYPEYVEEVEITPIDEEVCAERIISAMDTGKTKAQAVGEVLQGSDDVSTFNRLWKEIEKEGKTLRAISADDFDKEADYKNALNKSASRLNYELWYTGIKAEKQTETFEGLKSKISCDEK